VKPGWAICVGVCVLITTAPVSAGDLSDGNGLYEHCRDPQDPKQKLVCAAYVRGMVDGLLEQGLSNCIPRDVTHEQAADIALRFLQDNPALRHFPSAALAKLSFWQAFNCLVDMPTPKR
jgi:hypothetical protein